MRPGRALIVKVSNSLISLALYLATYELANVPLILLLSMKHQNSAEIGRQNSFQLLSEMCIFNNIHNNNITQFEEQMHRMLPLVIVQLRSSTFDVRVACYDALVQMSILFDSYGANGCSKIVTNNCAVGLRGKTIDNYEQFIIELSKLINLSFPQRKYQIF